MRLHYPDQIKLKKNNPYNFSLNSKQLYSRQNRHRTVLKVCIDIKSLALLRNIPNESSNLSNVNKHKIPDLRYDKL